MVQPGLVQRIPSCYRGGDALVDVADGAQHALAGVAFRIAIAQLQRFVHASRGARRDRGPADTSVVQADVDFDGRVAP